MLADMTTPLSNSGFMHDDLDEGIRPQDDLYLHVNNRWIEETPMPEDKARYGTFDVLNDMSEQAIREISTSRARRPKGAKPERSVTSIRVSSTRKPSTLAVRGRSSIDSRRSNHLRRSTSCWL